MRRRANDPVDDTAGGTRRASFLDVTDPPDTESDSGPAPHPDIELAWALADTADAISLARFGAGDLQVSAKPDLTPVTDADLAVEQALRDQLARYRPDDQVVGEEFGAPAGGSSGGYPDGGAPRGGGASPDKPVRQWILDPIDGTKNFVRGVPVWATLIGLFQAGRPVLGMVSAPALGRRWWARVGGGAFGSFAGGPARRLRVSGVGELSDASLSFSELGEWQVAGLAGQFRALCDRCWRTRGYGDFFSYMLVAQGAVDIAAEPELSLWDLAALAPIVSEAGGEFTALDGAPVGLQTRSALASNGRLHPVVRAALNPGSAGSPPVAVGGEHG